MHHVNRAGRKEQIFKILQRNFKKKSPCGMTVGQVAKRLGLKSSTHLKTILLEMVEEYDQINTNRYDWGIEFSYTEFSQNSFLDREITINHERVKVASWVASMPGYQL